MPDQASRIKLFIETPFWYCRPNNTDWRYTKNLGYLNGYDYFDVRLSDEVRLVLEENWSWLKNKMTYVSRKAVIHDYIRHVYDESIYIDCDVVYSHGRLPVVKNLPTAWFYGIVDPKMRIARGESEKSIFDEYSRLRTPFEQANCILLPTKAMVKRHVEMYPDLEHKFQYAPFFLNDINPLEVDDVLSKHENDEIVNILFVGREAHRKGLDILLASIRNIQGRYQRRYRVDVVTKDKSLRGQFADLYNVHWHNDLLHRDVMQLMKKAHVFAMPSRFESYGLVYIEAMASGAVVIAPNWESQIEILDGGSSGCLVSDGIEELTLILTGLLDRTLRQQLAIQARKRFERLYSADATSIAHYNALMTCLS